MPLTTHIEWSFPGGEVGLLLTFLLLLAAILCSYRFSRQNIAPKRRVLPAILRLSFCTLLLLCLARPTRIEERTINKGGKQTVAVLIDDSTSMRRASLSGSSRFETAHTYWKRNLEPLADRYTFQCFQFGHDLRPASPFQTQTTNGFSGTALYHNLAQWNATLGHQGIDAVICMTDGIDTTETSPTAAADRLRQTDLPHAFIPITAPVKAEPSIAFRKVEVQPLAKTDSQVTMNLVVASSGGFGPTPPTLALFDGKTEIYRGPLDLPTDQPATRVYPFNLSIQSEGLHHFRAEIDLPNKRMAQTEWSVEGTAEETLKVLLYQGGLDWGTRHIRDVFARDPRTDLTVEFAPNAFPALMESARNEKQFPSLATLSQYDVVIILKMRNEQIENQMNEALQAYVSSGGSLLFLIANTLDAQAYINSPLETFLPVEFESINKTPQNNRRKLEQLRRRLNAYGRPQHNRKIGTRLDTPTLCAFNLTEEGQRNPIFAFLNDPDVHNPLIPHFQDFALVRNRKPGARVLAEHPTARSDSAKRILMATQTFGKGLVAVLATDPLWRWKLNINSHNPSYDEFWKSMMTALGAGRFHTPYWDRPTQCPVPDTPLSCTLNNVRSGLSPTAHLIDLDTQTTNRLPLAVSDTPLAYTTTFTPQAGKHYRLQAVANGTKLAESILSCAPAVGHRELQDLKPNLKQLQQFAATSHRHTLVPPDQNFDWTDWLPAARQNHKTIQTRHPLWHRPWLFALLLTLFLTELILRRKNKLV